MQLLNIEEVDEIAARGGKVDNPLILSDPAAYIRKICLDLAVPAQTSITDLLNMPLDELFEYSALLEKKQEKEESEEKRKFRELRELVESMAEEEKRKQTETAELLKALEEIKEKMPESSPPEPAPDTKAPEALIHISAIAGYYPLFASHYSKLEEAQCIESNKQGAGLHWKKSKQSLAEYFDAIKPKNRKHEWKTLENIFGVSNLRQAASQNRNPFKGKKFKDFEEIKKIITLT